MLSHVRTSAVIVFEDITKTGKSHRPGLFLYGGCRGHFTVAVDTASV
jgi:hypothetical protein